MIKKSPVIALAFLALFGSMAAIGGRPGATAPTTQAAAQDWDAGPFARFWATDVWTLHYTYRYDKPACHISSPGQQTDILAESQTQSGTIILHKDVTLGYEGIGPAGCHLEGGHKTVYLPWHEIDSQEYHGDSTIHVKVTLTFRHASASESSGQPEYPNAYDVEVLPQDQGTVTMHTIVTTNHLDETDPNAKVGAAGMSTPSPAEGEPMLPTKGMALSGSYAEHESPDEENHCARGTSTFTWTLSPGLVPEVEAVIETPQGYDTWCPNAGWTEEAAGPTPLIVKVHLQKKGDPKSPPPQKAQFKFELSETSKESGVCLNWPSSPKETYDLGIEPGKNPDLIPHPEQGELVIYNQSAETRDKDLDKAQVTISSFDWGAYGELKVTAVLGDGTSVLAHLETDPSQTVLKIPRDDDGNKIGDGWQTARHLPPWAKGDDDPEADPAGDHAGDGLTLYEEYRGFMENGHHICGNPWKKDLFICNKIGPSVKPGIALFRSLSGLEVHSGLKPNELGEDRVINRNHSDMPHAVDQHGLFMVVGPELGYSEAHSDPKTNPEGIIGTPKRCDEVRILGSILGAGHSGERTSTTAHELFHCCNVRHHGGGDPGDCEIKTRLDEEGNWRIFLTRLDDDGQPILPRIPITLIREADHQPVDVHNPLVEHGVDWWVAVKQGQHSGDVKCVMRYNVAECYLNATGNYVYFSGKEVRGMSVCTGLKGTGINDPERQPEPRYGNAQADRGACRSKICVNDRYH